MRLKKIRFENIKIIVLFKRKQAGLMCALKTHYSNSSSVILKVKSLF
jgi:hypothetical protein